MLLSYIVTGNIDQACCYSDAESSVPNILHRAMGKTTINPHICQSIVGHSHWHDVITHFVRAHKIRKPYRVRH